MKKVVGSKLRSIAVFIPNSLRPSDVRFSIGDGLFNGTFDLHTYGSRVAVSGFDLVFVKVEGSGEVYCFNSSGSQIPVPRGHVREEDRAEMSPFMLSPEAKRHVSRLVIWNR